MPDRLNGIRGAVAAHLYTDTHPHSQLPARLLAPSTGPDDPAPQRPPTPVSAPKYRLLGRLIRRHAGAAHG